MKIFELTQVFEPGATNPSEEAETLPLHGVAGLTCDTDPAALLDEWSALFPVDCDAAGEGLMLTLADARGPAFLGAAAYASGDEALGGKAMKVAAAISARDCWRRAPSRRSPWMRAVSPMPRAILTSS